MPGVALQTSHAPEHAVAQQTPSAQIAETQDEPLPQDPPSFVLHAPAASHVDPPVQVPGSSALVTGPHVPGVVAQVWQVPVQGVAQQYPSTQGSDAHSRHPGCLQSPPGATLHVAPPPLDGTHAPPAAQ